VFNVVSRHRGAVAERLVWPSVVVNSDPFGDSSARLATIWVAFRTDVFVLQAAPQLLDEHVVQRPRPPIEIWTPARSSVLVKLMLVNWLPWSVLKTSGRPKRASASSSAETQNFASHRDKMIDEKHAVKNATCFDTRFKSLLLVSQAHLCYKISASRRGPVSSPTCQRGKVVSVLNAWDVADKIGKRSGPALRTEGFLWQFEHP